ncbi:xylan 1,4-beta-xylosidase [Cellulomonas bogoriensis 69B4 = DSM 16987]|uniref:Xylan 1,4-beta-xylosidase n=1 Tax=Cellulomonas bogoriensis 69B4 = DSM 16987 TaxID=1386082 RepID=A0A0A0BTH6_9CELL|nr:xylan 1,4-beta-xylosidase [Cellulomonas bogoriensis 69B4 = DSM 16987]
MRVVVPSTPVGPMSQAWRECVGTGRMNLALRQDYQDALALTQQDIGFRYIRGHGLFSDDMGVYREYEHQGRRSALHSYTYVDQVVDSYLAKGLRPFVELGFMPDALASGDQTVFWWKGNVTPPRSYREWETLVRTTVAHLVDRYGLDEVRTWPIEVWNEPNLVHFWKGADQQEYFRLYEVSVQAVKSVDADLQVGGPAISPGSDEWWEPFARFVTERDLPVDFVSRHAYTTKPAQHVPFGVYQDMWDPQSLLDQFAAARKHLAGTRLEELPVHITEFNTSYRPDNPVHDTAFNAAYLAPVLVQGGQHADSFSYWTFSDVFEEENIPTALFHGGFGLLGHRQVRKPTYHLYAFMARMGADVLASGPDHLVCADPDGRVTVLAWQPVVADVDAPSQHRVQLSLPVSEPCPTYAAAEHVAPVGETTPRASWVRLTVNEDEGNAWTAWKHMGRPRSPRPREVDLLHELSRPGTRCGSLDVVDGRVELDLTLGRHEVTFVEVRPVRDETPPWLDDTRIPGYRGA